MTESRIEKAVEILRRRAAGYEGRATAIFSGRIMADELRANAREIEALEDSDEAALAATPDGPQTHRASWRRALELARAMAAPPGVEHDDAAYWDHEIAAFDRAFSAATPAVGGEALDSETIQILLDLLNPLHGALDYQIHVNSEGEHVYDAPPDYEHHVIVLAQQDRGLTQAVLILENRRAAQPASQPAVGGLTESERVLVAHWRKWCSQAYTSRLDNAKTALLDLIPIIDRLAADPVTPTNLRQALIDEAKPPRYGEPVWPNNYMSNDLDKGNDA